MDWTKATNDPLNQVVARGIRDHLKKISCFYSKELVSFFCDVAKGKDVLHIGCYEHDHKYVQSENWKHKKIDDIALTCVGLDISERGVDYMKSLGYETVHADATSTIDLKKRFDTIIAGDVIEHVDNIGGLIRFSARHLTDNGDIYFSTPNPFYFGNVVAAWTKRPMIANFEHTAWLSESTMLEVARRENLVLEKIIYPCGNSSKNTFYRWLKKISFKLRSTIFFTTIIYQLKRPA